MIMKRSDFYYDLPEELIAQTPIEKRDNSRLMVLDRHKNGVEHRRFYDICDYFNKGDCLVINETRVLPARLYASRKGGTAPVEILLLKDLGQDNWECIVYPGKKLRQGAEIDCAGKLKGTITDVLPDGNRVVHFEYDGIFLEILEELGTMPLPHYITERLEDKERYQTVFARESGSAAAPTAGLHFTPELLCKLEEKGVNIAKITLHVGLGTFRPVKADNITDHVMHSEFYKVSAEAAEKINTAKQNGNKVIACGTTSCRTIESACDENGMLRECSGNTNIFIYPGYKFKCLDSLITNFHLPESTLIMLVSALAGREKVLDAYKSAVDNKYRFFSFGDAMIIV